MSISIKQVVFLAEASGVPLDRIHLVDYVGKTRIIQRVDRSHHERVYVDYEVHETRTFGKAPPKSYKRSIDEFLSGLTIDNVLLRRLGPPTPIIFVHLKPRRRSTVYGTPR